MTAIKVDVLVSGAGPVGLFFAYQMAKRGHSIYCVDSKSGPTEKSRAILITSRSMEILEARGFAAEVISESFVSSGIRMFRNGVYVSSRRVHYYEFCF
jgi:2-polyprenyl-6-methoxyphenol hydroxylase-like FAD-dependent oxidoreductase